MNKKSNMKQKIGILIIGLLLIACKGKASIEKEVHKIQEQKQEKIEHLKTFAKVYGYVKYFHPSDEASDIDWNSFAAYGANAILKSDSNEIIATLNHLFNPIAPSVVFSNTKKDYDYTIITPQNTTGYEAVYWQHKGVSKDMEMQDGAYRSVRVNRFTEHDESNGFGSLSVSINPENYRGKEIKYTGWVKLKDDPKSEGTGHLWLRVDKPDKTAGFFDNMQNNPITSNEWKQYEIIGEVDDLASGLFVGCFLLGKGTMYLDDVHVYYKENNEWIEIPIENNNFETNNFATEIELTEWGGNSPGYSFTLSNSEHKKVKAVLL